MVSAENKLPKQPYGMPYFEHKLPVREANEFKIIQWNPTIFWTSKVN